ncbi:putative RNA polymerase sigma factor FecI [compost metagenome]
MDHFYRQRVSRLPLVSGEREHGLVPTQGNAADARLHLMQRALDELSPACRDSFLLRRHEGLSHSQIAARLGLTPDRVEQHIVAAMKHMRVRLKQWQC